jgi:hypothetical protein
MVVTFVISSHTKVTARTLDDRRLGKQRVEAAQIISILENKNGKVGFKQHPMVKCWEGYILALKDYCNIMIEEWILRGKNNTMEYYDIPTDETVQYPPWYYNEKVHHSHMARLLQKDPTYYKDIPLLKNCPLECLEYGYIWPNKWSKEQLDTLSISELSEEKSKDIICKAIKKNGIPCNNKATYGEFCGVHKPKDFKYRICNALKKDGTPCKNKVKNSSSEKCGVHKNIV